MDIEQLKLILETLQAAGEGAFLFGIIWMIKGFLTSFINPVAVIVGLFIAYKAIVSIVRGFMSSSLLTGVLPGRWMYYDGTLRYDRRNDVKNKLKQINWED